MTTTSATRTFGAGCLVLSPLCYAASQLTWPHGSEGSNAQVVTLAATHPATWYAAAALEGVAALLGLVGVAVLALVVDGRGRILARTVLGLALCQVVGSVATWVLNASLVAQAARLPHDRVLAAYDATRGGYLLPFVALLFLGVLGSILLLVAAARARLAPWWVLVVGLVGVAGTIALTGDVVRALPPLVTALAFAVVARGMRQPVSTGRVGSLTQPLHEPA